AAVRLSQPAAGVMHPGELQTTRPLWPRIMPIGIALALCAAGWAQAPASPREVEQENRRCFNCHSQAHLAELGPEERRAMVAGGTVVPGAPEMRPELFVPPDALASGPHAQVACVSCHV